MSASLVFSFAVNVDPQDVIRSIAAHFNATVTPTADEAGVIIHFGTPAAVPAHIKQAVERVGADLNAGVELNPAVAFGGLVNGSGEPGNVVVPSSVVAETSVTVQTGNADTLATSAPVSSPAAPQVVNVAVAPSVPAAPTSLANVDKEGLPHDARIHSTPPSQTAKGVWRKKRGVDDTTIAQVEAELRAIVGNVIANIPAPASSPSVPSAAPVDDLVFADGNAKKQAAAAYAHKTAIEVVGPQIVPDNVLNDLLNGKGATLSPQQNDWFCAFFAKRNSAYAEFMNKAKIAPPVTVIAEPSAPMVDATGLKWDTRIHSNPPAFNSDGVYVQRMDVPAQTKLDVMAELRGNGAGTQSTVPDTPVTIEPVAPVVAPQPPSVDPASSFPQLMKWISLNMAAKRIDVNQVCEVAAMHGFVGPEGVGAISKAASSPEYFGGMVEVLRAYGAV